MIKRQNQKKLVDDFNARYSIGTEVEFWNFQQERANPRRSCTRTKAQLLSGHTAVVWLEGVSGCWALSNVIVVKE